MRLGSVDVVRRSRARQPGDNDDFDALILDGPYKQSLRSAQNLGRAGLRVAIGMSQGQYDLSLPVPTFRSRYCALGVVFSSYYENPASFADAVLGFVRDHPTRVILPTGDGTIAALAPRRAMFAELGTTLALASDAALDVANHKDRTLEVASRLGIEYPKSVRIDSVDDLKTAAAELGFPFVLKPTFSWLEQSAQRVSPVEVIDETEAEIMTRRLIDAGAGILAQEYALGLREEVTLLIVDGEVVVSCGHLEYRKTPQLGGISVMRESIQVPPGILDSSIRLAKAIGLEGPCGIEFRRNAENQPLLMEINARLGGALESATRSGIDLPLMVWQWAMCMPVQKREHYRVGVRTRWLEGDVRWLEENFSRRGRPDSVPIIQGIWIFASEFARTRYYDFLDWGDLMPTVAEFQNLATLALRRVKRTLQQRVRR
jgi:predicted ATP-grasp superfamily ATP-dependent carboligase